MHRVFSEDYKYLSKVMSPKHILCKLQMSDLFDTNENAQKFPHWSFTLFVSFSGIMRSVENLTQHIANKRDVRSFSNSQITLIMYGMSRVWRKFTKTRFMSDLATQLVYSAGEFQALQVIVLAAFGDVLTTSLLYVCPLFGNRISINSWAVGLTYWIVNLHFFYICNCMS